MVERLGYIGGPTGGVPERIFDKEFVEGKIEGVSKKSELFCKVSPTQLVVSVVGEPDPARFLARLEDKTLQLNIYNKGKENKEERHPDIYAGALVRRFVKHTKEAGQTIDKIHGCWLPWSDNHQQFMDYLEGIKNPTTTDEIQAAKSTWTGKLATSLGYEKVRVDSSWREEHVVEAHFLYGH